MSCWDFFRSGLAGGTYQRSPESVAPNLSARERRPTAVRRRVATKHCRDRARLRSAYAMHRSRIAYRRQRPLFEQRPQLTVGGPILADTCTVYQIPIGRNQAATASNLGWASSSFPIKNRCYGHDSSTESFVESSNLFRQILGYVFLRGTCRRDAFLRRVAHSFIIAATLRSPGSVIRDSAGRRLRCWRVLCLALAIP